jgi:N-acetylmuramoyl-L-alanine amidase
MKIVISSGHGKYVRGASGLIDEVDEARKVVAEVAQFLKLNGHQVVEFHDDTSTTQSENLNTIVDFHNSQSRNIDVSVHFNAYMPTDGGRGTECLYLTQDDIAKRVAMAISEAGGLIDRGAHKRSDLYFLNGTNEPAILIEVCFVDAAADVEAAGTTISFRRMCWLAMRWQLCARRRPGRYFWLIQLTGVLILILEGWLIFRLVSWMR